MRPTQVNVSGGIKLKSLPEGGRVIEISPDGGRLHFAGLRFKKGQYLVMELTVQSITEFQMVLGFSKRDPGSEQGVPDLYCMTGFLPQIRIRTYFDLVHLDAQSIYLERTPGKLKSFLQGAALEPEQAKHFEMIFLPFYTNRSLILHDLYLADEKPDCSLGAEVEPIVDELGQLKMKDWSGKTGSADELVQYLRKEAEAGPAADFGPEYSVYGGYKSISFEPTGYFRVVQHDGRSWLVDPDGYAFYSKGLDVVAPGETGRIDGIEPCFEWLPDEEGPFRPAFETRGGRKGERYYSYAVSNLIRAFGENYDEAWSQMTRSRLIDWGFNTIGNWSDLNFAQWAKLPYVIPLAEFPMTEVPVYRDFPDVFSEEYREASERYAAQLKPFKEDRCLIGYFMSNEPHWAFGDRVNLAREMFRSAHAFASKEELIHYLEHKYQEDPQALSEAWAMELADFGGVRQLHYDQFTDAADADLLEFSRRMAHEFIRVPAEALKRVDPNHLNLGIRYAWISSELVLEGSEYFDVYTYNCYKFRPDEADIRYIYEQTGKPVMIGEFHFGAPDVGLLSPGLKGVYTQADRGKAYRYYAEFAASQKHLVGAHYFILNDQATLGRFDGENYQIGIVDVCHRPYEAFVQEIKATHEGLLDVLLGKREPYDVQPKELIIK
ncbi:hypothetical protein M3G15_14160 [Paenibacillus sp. p3-SID1389]|uniref:hypothetical protein n=1 Tax=Paenibacillus sp. p3-SID1389 TaxID=2916364 RepID=UPI0021A726E7|nr:hypothetical protein [Paenibacillus sp. p3-SID1389]MCT2196283.1 hypothetical protein [Paenibacillus sp. p3-SID1389]